MVCSSSSYQSLASLSSSEEDETSEDSDFLEDEDIDVHPGGEKASRAGSRYVTVKHSLRSITNDDSPASTDNPVVIHNRSEPSAKASKRSHEKSGKFENLF